MTKEDFSLKFILLLRDRVRSEYIKEFEELVGSLLESNIVIPKGLQPHPYADVWHAYAEGEAVQWTDTTGSNVWYDKVEHSHIAYRIKPQEVYEWQWVTYNDDGVEIARTSIFMTDDEWLSCDLPYDNWKKDHYSKRERK